MKLVSLKEEIQVDPFVRVPKHTSSKKPKTSENTPWYLNKKEVQLYEKFLNSKNIEYLKYG